MPELPEVETIRRGLQKMIVGKTIKSVDVRLPKIVSIGPATVSNIRSAGSKKVEKFKTFLRGQKIAGVKRRAKMLIIDLKGPYAITVHLKMTGQLIYARKNELPKKAKIFNKPDGKWLTMPHKYTHVVFNFTDGSKLYYNDLRQFGYLRLVHDDEVLKIKELREFGPEPLSKDFIFDYFWKRAKARKTSIKQFLVDPKVVAGVGNIYSDEILYCAKLRPQRKAGALKKRELERVFTCIPKVLKEALKYHGSSVGDYFQANGAEGSYGRIHRVYGRAGQKCRKCGSIIKSAKFGGRTGSYCPRCQK